MNYIIKNIIFNFTDIDNVFTSMNEYFKTIFIKKNVYYIYLLFLYNNLNYSIRLNFYIKNRFLFI